MTDIETFDDEPDLATDPVVETAEESVEDGIRAAFDTAVEEGADEDDVKMAMLGAGASFKNVARLYNQFNIDAGLAMSKEDRDAVVTVAIEGDYDLTTEDGFDACVAEIQGGVTNATERSAAALLRAAAKKTGTELYAKPKSVGGTRSTFAGDFKQWIIDNPELDEAAVKAYINGEGDNADTSDNIKKHVSHYLGLWNFANSIRAKAA